MTQSETIDLLKQSLNVAQETIEIHRSQVLSLTSGVTELQDKLKLAVDALERINKLKPLWIYSDNLAEDPQWAVEAEAINNMSIDIAETLTKLTDK